MQHECYRVLAYWIIRWLNEPSFTVQVCNAVVVAALLNATLVVPRFLYSSVWKDTRY